MTSGESAFVERGVLEGFGAGVRYAIGGVVDGAALGLQVVGPRRDDVSHAAAGVLDVLAVAGDEVHV